MPQPLTLERLEKAVSGSAAAFRCLRRLQPAGGAGDKVFPPTFKGKVYSKEKRRIEGRAQPVECVLLDGVASQANRMELALQDAVDSSRIELPLLEVDFSDHSPTGDEEFDEKNGRFLIEVPAITSLQAPHRLADGIIRDSHIDGVPFRKTERGRALNSAGPLNATPLLTLCPSAIVFGMWDSTGPKGGLGAKFERIISSEVVGIGAEIGDDVRGVRNDPLGIRSSVKIVKKRDRTYALADEKAKNTDAPSAVNHGNVVFSGAKNGITGVTIEYASQWTTISLIALRRLRFPIEGKTTKESEDAARTVLAALGLCAATLAFENGLGLRSRCLLWPEAPMQWELLDKPGDDPEPFSITSDEAVEILNAALAKAKEIGIPFDGRIVMKPNEELVKLTRLSQIATAKNDEDSSKSTEG